MSKAKSNKDEAANGPVNSGPVEIAAKEKPVKTEDVLKELEDLQSLEESIKARTAANKAKRTKLSEPIKVVAIKLGYRKKRVRPGDIFYINYKEEFSPKWMKLYTTFAKEAALAAQDAEISKLAAEGNIPKVVSSREITNREVI